MCVYTYSVFELFKIYSIKFLQIPNNALPGKATISVRISPITVDSVGRNI